MVAQNAKDDTGVLPQFERRGVDTVAEHDQTSTPWTFFGIAVGSSWTLANLVFGWIAVTLGLNFWQALSAITVGVLLGMVVAAPMSIIGSYAATNNSTASGAHFGVRGRLVGSGIGLALTLLFTALGIWTAGDSIVSVCHRLFGLPENDAVSAITYAVVAAAVIGIALWGYHLLVRFEIALCVICAPILLLVVVAVWGRLDETYPGGDYAFGGFWTTWVAAAVVAGAASPLTLTTVMGDWSRYVSPRKYPARKFLPIALLGVFLALVPTEALGALVAVTFPDPFTEFVPGLVEVSPAWYVVLLLPLAVLGGIGLAASTVYSSGLDLEAMLPRMSRLWCTITASAFSVGLVFLGAFVFNAGEAISAILLILTAVIAPWAAITGIGFIRSRGRYSHDDLQVFNRGQVGGRYWFAGGWNPIALTSFALGSSIGLLTVNTTIYVGPLANIAGGADVSFIGSLTVGALSYLLLLRIFHEPAVPVSTRGISTNDETEHSDSV